MLVSGILPPQLSKLSLLQEVHGFRNALGGTLSFQAWSAMTFLDLSYMQLSGTLPQNIALASSMNYLSLGNNSLSGPVPSSLGELAASGTLTSLGLRGNAFTGSLDPRLLGLLSLCTDPSVASSFGSPDLVYSCLTAPSPSPAAVLGWDVIGPIIGGGALLVFALLLVAWRIRARRLAPLSPSSAALPSVSAMARESSEPPTASNGADLATPRSPSSSLPGALLSEASGRLPQTGDPSLLWQCDFHHCGAHDVYLW